MSKMPSQKEVEAFLNSLPGKRGVDIPADIFDIIAPAAHGFAKKIWGTSASPHQLQYLYENGHHQPSQVDDAFSALPHPLAPSVKVGEYDQHVKALQMYNALQQKGPR